MAAGIVSVTKKTFDDTLNVEGLLQYAGVQRAQLESCVKDILQIYRESFDPATKQVAAREKYRQPKHCKLLGSHSDALVVGVSTIPAPERISI